ncbi:MAG: hypothetical protein IT336_02150 [Thermomicrobiales bacterium]|nr:hypothetical protein [Thermomicrobiales bacterium]
MAFDRTTQIRGATTITAARAVAYAASKGAKATFRDYLAALWDMAPRLGINPLAVMGQWCDETATGTSPRWLRGDPAGLGIFADNTPSTLASNLTGKQSAAIHVVELATKLNRVVPPRDTVDGIDVAALDPHLQRVLQFVARPDWPAIATLHDLRIPLAGGDFTWAANQAYGDQIANHMNAIAAFAEGTPMPNDNLVFGNVPHPAFEDRPIQKAEGAGMNDLGQRTVKGVTWHRMLGTLNGTDGFFRRNDVNALTDYGVGVESIDGTGLDGTIFRWNDPLGRQSGWASGTWSAPHAFGDGRAFVNKYGIDAINRDRASIEISGHENTPLTEKSRQAIAELTAFWADQAKIPWDSFPIVPADGFSFVCWHEEFGPEFGQKKCPFTVVKNETVALIERTKNILKAAQTNTVVAAGEEFTPSELPAWWDASLMESFPADQAENGVNYWVMRRLYRASSPTLRRSKPDIKAPASGPKLQAADAIQGERIVENGRQWVLTNDGHYVLASKLKPRVKITT